MAAMAESTSLMFLSCSSLASTLCGHRLHTAEKPDVSSPHVSSLDHDCETLQLISTGNAWRAEDLERVREYS